MYHGWKFDVDGHCVDMITARRIEFLTKVQPRPTHGSRLIWAYMGPSELQPPLPNFAWTQVPETHRHVSKVIQENNWLQGLEGGIDTSHAPILHRLITTNSDRPGIKLTSPFVRGKAPTLAVDLTDYGYQYAGIRPLGRPRCTSGPITSSCRSIRFAPR